MSCSVDKDASLGFSWKFNLYPLLVNMLHEAAEKRSSKDYLQPLKGE